MVTAHDSHPSPPALARATTVALLTYTAVTVAYTWPLVLNLGSMVPHDVGDPVLNTWILWWNAFHWPLTSAWWNAPIFVPADHALAFSEHLLGLSLISAPVIQLSGNPLLGYNVCFLLTFALSATAAFLLVLELTGRRDAAFLAGLAFGFCPYRVAQLSHLQVLAAFWIPVVLFALHRYLAARRRIWLALFGVAFVLQALTNGYYLVFMPLLIGLWLIWFGRTTPWRQLAAIAVASLAALGSLLPFLVTYRSVHAKYALTRNIEVVRLYSADLAAAGSGSPLLWFWNKLPAYGSSEGALFLGVTVVGLILAGAFVHAGGGRRPGDRSKAIFVFYAIAAVVFYALALGPTLTLFAQRLDFPGPYALVVSLPGFSSLRVPARLGIIVALCAAIAGAAGFARLSNSWPVRRRSIAAAVLASAICLESWPREIPLWEPPRPWQLSDRDGAGPLLVVPILNELNEAASMYRSMFHHRPLVNGYSGHIPPWYLALKEGLNDTDPAVLEELAAAGVTQAAVITRNDQEGSWREYVRSRGAEVRQSTDGTFTLFDLRKPHARLEDGQAVPIVAVSANVHPEIANTTLDNRSDTWWSTLAPQAGGEEIVIDLGSAQPAGAVEIALGSSGFEYPRRLEIQTSPDGALWTTAWSGPTSGLTVGALMRSAGDPRIFLPFPDQRARFIKLRQTGRHRTASWTVAGIRVFGPSARSR